jgi:hypothetical protein
MKMKPIIRRAFIFFITLTFVSLTLLLITEAKAEKTENQVVVPKMSIKIADADETLLNSILSALGGFGGGGILLLFLIRRLVNSYDATFEKIQKKEASCEKYQRDQNDKIVGMIEELHDIANDLRLEVMKLQVNSVDKDTLTEALTRVTLLEANVNQVQTDVKDIVARLIG